MLLTKLRYEEGNAASSGWAIGEVRFGGVALIVGKNSSGKTRLLNLINNLAKLVAGKIPPNFATGAWVCDFERRKGLALEHQTYRLEIKNQAVSSESLEINRSKYMERRPDGHGFVIRRASKARVEYKVPSNQLMAVVRRDEIQHPHFEHLHDWGTRQCYYRFGSEFGKNTYSPLAINELVTSNELETSNLVDNAAHVFRKTFEKFSDKYKQMVLEDLRGLDYACSDIFLQTAQNVIYNGMPPLQLGVQEEGLGVVTYQNDMSQGMYRALAIIVHMNANILWAQSRKVGRDLVYGDSPMIMIDDIGEGMDFTRSRALVKRMMEKAKEHSIQLIMSSNDRFIMNDVPLEHWVILHRNGQKVRAFDQHNSEKIFKEFDYLGLNNFDFFSGEVFLNDVK